MLIRYGYEIVFHCWQPVLMVTLLDAHPERAQHIRYETPFTATPDFPSSVYVDGFGNHVRRFMTPVGTFTITRDFVMEDDGVPNPSRPEAREVPLADLPSDVIPYLLGSRYCETDKLGAIAWNLFGWTTPGWHRVQTIVDYVNAHLTFGYQHARATRTAFEAYEERVGVCRDFAHLAVAFCRCMNIPTRYANGFLGDIGIPPDPAPMDYNAWLEVYLDGEWITLDARHNVPRVGRIIVARGRDATDIPLATSFGPHNLNSFRVWTDEIDAAALEALKAR